MTGQLTWLVTGCSSGFGEAFVHGILAKGDRVIATARPRNNESAVDRLAPLKTAGAAVMEIDVTAPAEVLKEKAKEAWSIYGQVDVLVNNAAYIDGGIFEEMDEEFLLRVLRNNTLGPLNLTRAFLPYMRARGTGTLIFLSSIAAYMGVPCATSYSSSKALLEGVVANMATEIEPFGLRTSLLIPGYFRTSVFTPGNIHLDGTPNSLPEYAEVKKSIREFCGGIDGTQPGDPRKAVDLVIEAVRGEGRCVGKQLPFWLPLGEDGFQTVEEHCRKKLEICEEWKELGTATNIE
ncbi:hypothetical protein BDV59DRAFT_203739 [Aspergillus ambiguus]|uniref:SDR family oxidoreductase n=1 Tax=Aspergillus ambiguus TaxID=176160 RepID=UPI003CCDB473